MIIEPFFDPQTSTLTYVVFDPVTRDALVIDPVLDYDPVGSLISTDSLDRVTAFLHDENLKLRIILETHAHADHMSGSQVLRARFPGAPVAIGERIREIQATFKVNFDLGAEFVPDGRQFDRLLSDGETVTAGSLDVHVLATPGHSPACLSYLIGDAVFTGDALFMPDYGTGRCDFPRGSASALHHSIIEGRPNEVRRTSWLFVRLATAGSRRRSSSTRASRSTSTPVTCLRPRVRMDRCISRSRSI